MIASREYVKDLIAKVITRREKEKKVNIITTSSISYSRNGWTNNLTWDLGVNIPKGVYLIIVNNSRSTNTFRTITFSSPNVTFYTYNVFSAGSGDNFNSYTAPLVVSVNSDISSINYNVFNNGTSVSTYYLTFVKIGELVA